MPSGNGTSFIVSECRALNGFLLPRGCWCYVSLPRGALGMSTVCDYGISWSNSLTYFILRSSVSKVWKKCNVYNATSMSCAKKFNYCKNLCLLLLSSDAKCLLWSIDQHCRVY